MLSGYQQSKVVSLISELDPKHKKDFIWWIRGKVRKENSGMWTMENM